MSAALETRELCKHFGALTVAEHINFTLEAGARHALIGPNGAGKTTFVNMLMGGLAPSSGSILLGGVEVTRQSQRQRVKQGLGRTFQINTLFRSLTVLDNVALAVAERHGVAWGMFRPAGRQQSVIDESMQVLESLGLAADATQPLAAMPYGKQRLVEIAIALGMRPRVLLLDEPAAGIPSLESHRILEVLDTLSADIAILIIEHDMELVFRFARRITVLAQGAVLMEGTPAEVASDARVRQVYLESGMSDMLRLSGVHAGYGQTVVLEDIEYTLAERSTLALLGRNGVGKTTLLATVMGLTTLHRGSIEYRGRPITRMAVHDRARLGIGYVPQAREIFPSLTVEENLSVAESPGSWTLERVYDLFPRVAERRRHMGNQISGGEQQMLAIGRALMGNPELLLMDEPFEGLAPTIVDTLLAAMQRLISETALTVVLVEQSAKLVLEVTRDAMVLNRGRITYAGASSELLADPRLLANLVIAQ